jgi:hypothetical protein
LIEFRASGRFRVMVTMGPSWSYNTAAVIASLAFGG